MDHIKLDRVTYVRTLAKTRRGRLVLDLRTFPDAGQDTPCRTCAGSTHVPRRWPRLAVLDWLWIYARSQTLAKSRHDGLALDLRTFPDVGQDTPWRTGAGSTHISSGDYRPA